MEHDPSQPVAGIRVGVIGLGLVGLPMAEAFARHFPTVGHDVDALRVALLRDGDDVHGQVPREVLQRSTMALTSDAERLRGCNVFILTVPVVLDAQGAANVEPLQRASHTVGTLLSPGALVVVETTGWPGLTAEVCVPELAAASGLQPGRDFDVAYSPERINPGDGQHTFGTTAKVVAADADAALARVHALYSRVVQAPLHAVRSIRVAEAAKLAENAQRDLNIALANELSLVFERLNLSTQEVLRASGTKWNFAPYAPGLVGGACVGLAPRLLDQAARAAGASPRLLLQGRAVNDGMVTHVVERLLRLMARAGIHAGGARVGILGCTYKANIADARHSRIPELVRDLASLGMEVAVADPLARTSEVARHQGITLQDPDTWRDLDAVILAVPHDVLRVNLVERVGRMLRRPGACIDLAWMVEPTALPAGIAHDAL